jgi:hypothetical protein
MKKLLIATLLLVTAISAFATQMVVVGEVFTETW